MEYCGEVTLQKYCRDNSTGRLSPKQALRIFSDVCSSMEYLHKCGFFHRDIKITNILIINNRYPKIIDFGFAGKIEIKQMLYCGTPSYMAPEIIHGRGYYGDHVDIWALGVVLYKILTGAYPFGCIVILTY